MTILANTGPPQLSKRFVVALSDVQGGAAIGTSDATVEITGDGDPVGQFDFQDSQLGVAEADGGVTVTVNRNYYSSGATSVTLTPVAGTATSADFTASPITVSWADGDAQPKTVMIPITMDNIAEPTESFTVTLSNATNGALIGPNSVVTVSITDSTRRLAPRLPAVGAAVRLTGLCWRCWACSAGCGAARRGALALRNQHD